jgi:hypothetical protein
MYGFFFYFNPGHKLVFQPFPKSYIIAFFVWGLT